VLKGMYSKAGLGSTSPQAVRHNNPKRLPFPSLTVMTSSELG